MLDIVKNKLIQDICSVVSNSKKLNINKSLYMIVSNYGVPQETGLGPVLKYI